MSRKKIALLSIFPEGEYQQRVMSGIFHQCQLYNYDVVDISPLVQVSNYNKDYVYGELNIYNLINFDLFDGVLITPIPMVEDQDFTLANVLLEKIKAECKKPVVSIDYDFGSYPSVFTEDKSAFFHITEHLIKKHKCKNFSVLAGPDNGTLSKSRMAGIYEALSKYNLELNPNQIYAGDYWYTSGELLGARYLSKELEMPDAVICLSDHMAIGLTNFLIKHGIKVPKELIVTGYGAVQEAAGNTPAITSYAADQSLTGARAVNKLHSILEPGAKEYVCKEAGRSNLRIGSTCGCKEDLSYIRESIISSQMKISHNYQDKSIWNKVDIGILQNSYMTETLTSTISPEECFSKIYEAKYLLKPYEHFYICMNQNWLDNAMDFEDGYSEKINLALTADREIKIHGALNHVFLSPDRQQLFPKTQMLPALFDNYDKPQVFFFVPLHFSRNSLGYAVLQNDLDNPNPPGIVFRTFIRYINNALEMIRTRYQIAYFAEHDTMTDLYNRRGMLGAVKSMFSSSSPDDIWFAIVIDMDNLKVLNDKFGHEEGDKGIISLANAARYICQPGEICVRGGGDEFYVIGLGKYTEADMEDKVRKFNEYLENRKEELKIPVCASVGYALAKNKDNDICHRVLDIADKKMYEQKQEKKSGKRK